VWACKTQRDTVYYELDRQKPNCFSCECTASHDIIADIGCFGLPVAWIEVPIRSRGVDCADSSPPSAAA